jgi:hypothetical protein
VVNNRSKERDNRMKLNNLGNNKTEVVADGKTIFFSYNTPVAAIVNGDVFKTSKHWSVTTSKHITQWLDGMKAEEKPQEFFDLLV